MKILNITLSSIDRLLLALSIAFCCFCKSQDSQTEQKQSPLDYIETTGLYDTAKWFFYQSNYDRVAYPMDNLYDEKYAQPLINTDIELHYLEYSSDSIMIGFSVKHPIDSSSCFLYYYQTLPNGQKKRGSWGEYNKFTFYPKKSKSVLKRKYIANFSLHGSPDLFWHPSLLPPHTSYPTGRHLFYVERDSFRVFLQKNKHKIKSQWLLKEARRRGILK